MIEFQQTLDKGEAEAIALAKELNADLVLMDEAKGRVFAQQQNVTVLGLLGVLRIAKDQGRIDHIKILMDRLQDEANFRISSQLYHQILLDANE